MGYSPSLTPHTLSLTYECVLFTLKNSSRLLKRYDNIIYSNRSSFQPDCWLFQNYLLVLLADIKSAGYNHLPYWGELQATKNTSNLECLYSEQTEINGPVSYRNKWGCLLFFFVSHSLDSLSRTSKFLLFPSYLSDHLSYALVFPHKLKCIFWKLSILWPVSMWLAVTHPLLPLLLEGLCIWLMGKTQSWESIFAKTRVEQQGF